MIREVGAKELRRAFDAGDISAAVDVGFIGQPRAEAALRFGLGVKAEGYNIYCLGESGTGKASFAELFARERAAGEAVPPDLLYAYNFEEPKEPKLIRMQAGAGRGFRQDMNELKAFIAAEVPRLFSGKDYEEERTRLYKGFQQLRDETIEDLRKAARAQGFGLRLGGGGMYFMPMVDGVTLSDEQYEELDDEVRDKLNEGSDAIQERAAAAMRDIKAGERSARKEVEALDYSVALMFIGRQVGRLQEKYSHEADVPAFLAALKEDVLDNISEFSNENEEPEEAAQMPWLFKRGKDDRLAKLSVNLITDNGSLTGAPVVLAKTLNHGQLIGEIEYDSEYGNVTTDFMKIKPGLLHKAAGGYLILSARDALTQPHVWDALRKALKTRELVIEPVKDFGTAPVVTPLRPQALELGVKVILTGDAFYYELLREYDDDFPEMFRVVAEFDDEMSGDARHAARTAAFIRRFADKEGAAFDDGAVAELLSHSSRLAGRQGKLTARFGVLEEALVEALAAARGAGRDGVCAGDVKAALAARDARLNMYEEKLSEMIEDGTILVDTEGAKVGQVNGLAVLDTGEYAFAKPTRITATTYAGQAGIVNIEEEADMSGAIHTKGVQVLTGYLGQNYAQGFPLSLSARVCFEQNYSGIDGDSASSAELYAILSGLSGAAIEQGIAVTGSMNQFGELQPVGGVTEKVEGFFDTCAKRGLNGRQGVLIPSRNAGDLNVAARVYEAVGRGEFHVWAAETVEDGIALLTGLEAAEVHALAQRKLKGYFKAGSGETGKKGRKGKKKDRKAEVGKGEDRG